jgi:hypothetical protein
MLYHDFSQYKNAQENVRAGETVHGKRVAGEVLLNIDFKKDSLCIKHCYSFYYSGRLLHFHLLSLL